VHRRLFEWAEGRIDAEDFDEDNDESWDEIAALATKER
jgi:hypothetical protein